VNRISLILNWASFIKVLGMAIKKLLLFCLLCFPSFLSGQSDSLKICKKYCDPRLAGMSPAKGLTLLYERAGNAAINSVSRDTSVGNASGEVRRNNRFDLDVKLPLLNKPNLKFIAGLKYFYEEFDFKKSSSLSDYALNNNLESKHLKSIGTNISILRSINETTYWISKLMVDLNGDYTNKQFSRSSFLKISYAFLFGHKKCETKTTAVGFYLNYALGRQSIFPVYLYNNTFNKHWGVEALVPAYIKGRYNFSDKALIHLGYEIEGASYNLFINNPEIAKYTSLQLRRSNIRYQIQFEKEIYKFIWMGINAGLRQTISFNVTTKGDRPGHLSFTNGIHIIKGDPLIRNTLNAAPFINLSLFIVASKDLLNKVARSDVRTD
jgi:hypothetical protein